MLTRNFVSMFKISTVSREDTITIANVEGNTKKYPTNAVSTLKSFPSSTEITNIPQNCCVLAIGNGSTPPTANNIKLASEIDTGFSVVSQATYVSDFSNSFATITRVIKNTSDTDIIVKEIGIIGSGFGHNSGGYGEFTGHFLIAREVLDAPVTIQPGEKHSFTIDLCTE